MANTDDGPVDTNGKSQAAKPPIAAALGDEDGGGAPRVVAKGSGAVAEQILQIAFDHGVKVREDADLAELLIAVDVESEIPLEALAAVAEILAYVYRANNALEAPPPDDAPEPAP